MIRILFTRPSLLRKFCSQAVNFINPTPLGNTPYWFKDEDLARIVANDLIIKEDFITTEEEQNLSTELDTVLGRQHYQKSHWDYAITDFRETERKTWRTINRPVIERLQNLTAATEFPKPATDLPIDQVVLPYIHVLDLAESGEIKAHIDSVRFCGGSVVVLSLLSDSVLRLAVAPSKEVVALPADQPGLAELSLPNPGSYVDLRIPRRSVYVMRGASRYLLTHAILSNTDVARLFAEHGSRLYDIQRPRRISVICRSRLRATMIPLKTTDSE
ncbi:Alpha-ketoglutarate-dependent dioxygenase alkB 7, mitochondrial [Clonorchis sinensis]|uniref:Alpha-ketoglutarate-dependent dioxygenase alkB 7, mitochondrial n=1 Tax=Clonorchis sinensis TaxID=79923 RepID=A0A3R7EPN6_CLOSI|nr:Alpha-ketoglutarate-dependent dioxygenase alkB 7, mitochondrial [Clonorchis sinensis]